MILTNLLANLTLIYNKTARNTEGTVPRAVSVAQDTSL